MNWIQSGESTARSMLSRGFFAGMQSGIDTNGAKRCAVTFKRDIFNINLCVKASQQTGSAPATLKQFGCWAAILSSTVVRDTSRFALIVPSFSLSLLTKK